MKPFEGIKFIAFDLDGTLLDSVPDLADAADQAMQALGRPGVSVEQVTLWIGNGADILIGRALSQSLEVAPDLDPALHQEARTLFDRFYDHNTHGQSDHDPDHHHFGSLLGEAHHHGDRSNPQHCGYQCCRCHHQGHFIG